MSKHHILKCWSPFFEDVQAGRKKFECRLNDRDFQEGDTVTLRHYLPEEKKYTGREWEGRITYVALKVPCGRPEFDGFCVFGIEPLTPNEVVLLARLHPWDISNVRHSSSAKTCEVRLSHFNSGKHCQSTGNNFFDALKKVLDYRDWLHH